MITITKFGKIFLILLATLLALYAVLIAFVYWQETSDRGAMFPVDKNADVYIIYHDERILVSDEDAALIKEGVFYTKICHGGKCPKEFDIAIEIGKYRYLPGLDGCGTLHLYTTDGKFIKSGENYCYNWIKKYTDNK